MITHVTASMTQKGGGIAYAVRDLVAALGVESRLHSLKDGGEALDGVTGCEHVIDYTFPLPQSKALIKALGSESPRLYHSHGLWSAPSIAVPLVAKKQGVPWMVSPHGMLDSWALANSRWKKRVASFLFERSHLSGSCCLHALCEAEAGSIRDYGLSQPVAVIPNGVVLPEGVPDREGRGERTLLFLGRLHPKKGLMELLRAWREVRPEGWRLVIAGWDEGGHGIDLRSEAHDLGEVSFAGAVYGAEKERLFQEADAFVLPSFSEGLPVAVLEAWSWGLPVLMTDECHLPEGFEAGAAVRLAQVDGRLEGLEDGLTGDLGEMGRQGRALVERDFTWERIGEQMAEVYQWVLGEGEKPECVR
ncbi:MAG: glycosyltransferase [Verrucomicrobiaceae bacterium]